MITTRHTHSALALLEEDTGGQRQQQGQQQDESASPSPAPGGGLNIEGSSPGSLSPHHRKEDTAPHEDNDGADGTGVSFETLMAAIDREHNIDLSSEQQEHRHHHQASEGQEQEGGEKEEEGGAVRTTAAAAAAAAAHPVEPTKAILGGTAVAEAIERAIAVTRKTEQVTKDAVSTFCDTMAQNQARVVDSWKGVANAAHTAVVQLAAEKSSLTARNKALQSDKCELKAQAHELQCILVAAVGEKDALSHKLQKAGARTKRLQETNTVLKAQCEDLQCILVAAVAEKDALAGKLEDATTMTTAMTVKPPPAAAPTTATVSPSDRPSALAFLASCAATAKPMSPMPAIDRPPTAAPIAPSAPVTITEVTTAPATSTIVAAPATPTSAVPIAPSTSATITAPRETPTSIAATDAPATPAITAVPTRVPSNDENRGGKVSGCPTGGRSLWVGVGEDGTATATRTPLSVIRTNTPRRAVPATAAKARKITTCVVTPGLASLTRGTKSSMAAARLTPEIAAKRTFSANRAVDSQKPAGPARQLRNSHGRGVAGDCYEAAGPKETRDASAARPSTRTRMADREKAEGMVGRLRSAGRPREDDSKNTTSVRGQKVSSGAGVSSRTRQATSRNKAAAGAAGGGKVVRKRWM